jgi:hypothetical protein
MPTPNPTPFTPLQWCSEAGQLEEVASGFSPQELALARSGATAGAATDGALSDAAADAAAEAAAQVVAAISGALEPQGA